MAYTDLNSEDRLVQATFAEHLERVLGWDSVYAWNHETFGADGTLGRSSTREVVLVRDLRAALARLNPDLPDAAIDEAVATHAPGADQASGLTVDLSHIDLDKLRKEFSRKVRCKATVIEDIRQIVEAKMAQMLAANPLRMNFEKKYQEIIAAYNTDKDRATVEETFRRMTDLIASIDEEQMRAVKLGLTEEQLAVFDLLSHKSLSGAALEQVKQENRSLLAAVQKLIAPLAQWTEKEQTQAEVEVFILDHVYQALPDPPYSEDDKRAVAALVYRHVWQQSASGSFAARQ